MTRITRTMTAAIVTALLVLLVPAGPAAGRPAIGLSLPVGVWQTDLDFGGGMMVHVLHSYTWRGELCHQAEAVGAHGFGKGTWRPTGRSSFSYLVIERFYDDAGVYFGRAEMSGNAVVERGVFRTQHTSSVYDVDGAFLGSDQGEIVFNRVSRRNPTCVDRP